MCDQTEVSYLPGDVVWVKLGPVWWPGVVANNEEIPPEITKNLRKTPIAIVKFFQEEEFEYVQKLSNIYHYNCLKKNDFIRKGLDMYRSKNREAPSNMKLFPEDVARAEILTGGNPDILHDEMFQPEEKPAYANPFAAPKKTPKKIKLDTKKKTSLATQQSIPRLITHPRFIKLSSGIQTDYEVRERKQEPVRAECDEEDTSPPTIYRCPDCDFTTIRLNVIVLHNKSHTRNYASPTPKKAVKRKNISAVRVKDRPSAEFKVQDTEPIQAKIPKTNGTILKSPKRPGRPRKSVTTSPAVNVTKTKEPEPRRNSRTLVTKPECDTPEKDEFQESLLEDWAEFETDQEENKDEDTSNESSIAGQENKDEDASNESSTVGQENKDEDATNESSTVSPTKNVQRRKSSSEVKSENEKHSGKKNDSSKSCFDFDDSEEQLVIDKSKIRAGRKIPRVLENKSEESKNMELEEEPPRIESINDEENVGIETVEEKEEEKKTEEEEEKYEENVKTDEKSPSEEIESEGELEIVTEEISVDHDIGNEQTEIIDTVTSSTEETKEDEAKAKEVAELSQKVDQLLEEVTVPAKLPELPRSLKKEQIKSYNASLTQRSMNDDDDQIIESISLLNDDDSSDNLDDAKNMMIEVTSEDEKKHPSNGQDIRRTPSRTTNMDFIENIEVSSESSPELVSIQMPTKVSTATPKRTVAKNTPIKFTTTAKLKTIDSSVLKRNMMVNSGANRVVRTVVPQTSRVVTQERMMGTPKTRPMLKTMKTAPGRNVIRLMSGQQVQQVVNASKKGNEFVFVKQLPGSAKCERPTTIANIDLTGSKVKVVPQVSSKVRLPSNVVQKSFKNMAKLGKVQPKNVVVRPKSTPMSKNIVLCTETAQQPKNVVIRPKTVQMLIQTQPASAVGTVTSVGCQEVQNESEILTVPDEIVYVDSNDPTLELSYIVNDAGELVVESASKKEDILAKALQDTDVLQTEMALANSTTITLDPCNVSQSMSSATIYENVTLNTPPIMSSFETPSRAINANIISEIPNEMIIISEGDNIEYIE